MFSAAKSTEETIHLEHMGRDRMDQRWRKSQCWEILEAKTGPWAVAILEAVFIICLHTKYGYFETWHLASKRYSCRTHARSQPHCFLSSKLKTICLIIHWTMLLWSDQVSTVKICFFAFLIYLQFLIISPGLPAIHEWP